MFCTGIFLKIAGCHLTCG